MTRGVDAAPGRVEIVAAAGTALAGEIDLDPDSFAPDRSRPMFLITEDLARSHMRDRLREAERFRRVARLQAARSQAARRVARRVASHTPGRAAR